MSDVDDGELLVSARRGDEDAFSELFARHRSAVYRYAAYMCGRDAADDINTARIAGAVYLDGAYRYAVHRPGARDNLLELKRKLDLLEAELNTPPRPPSEQGELRAGRSIAADGSIGPPKASAEIGRMLESGGQRFTSIPVPTLAIFASPHDQGPWTRRDPATRAGFEAFARFDEAMTEHQASWVERRVPGARVVRLRNAHHYLFITHAREVLQEIGAFLKGL